MDNFMLYLEIFFV